MLAQHGPGGSACNHIVLELEALDQKCRINLGSVVSLRQPGIYETLSQKTKFKNSLRMTVDQLWA